MVLAMYIGAPYVPTKQAVAAEMIALLDLKKGALLYDLGSGDGRLLLMAAKKGINGVGVEIIPHIALWSWLRVWVSGLRSHIKIIWGNYWWISLKSADAVVVYGIPGFMPRFAQKFKKELKPGTRIVSNSFTLPGLRVITQKTIGKDRIFLYTV